MPPASTLFFASLASSWCGRALWTSTSRGGGASGGRGGDGADTAWAAPSSSGGDSASSAAATVTTGAIRDGSEWGVGWDSQWDGLGAVAAPKGVKRQLLLVRHGQYENEAGSEHDHDKVLTALGVEQAKLTGEYLRRTLANSESELFVDSGLHRVTSSNMTRAMQTAEHLLDNLDPALKQRWVLDAALRERFPCNPQPAYPKQARPEDHKQVEAAFRKYVHRPKAGSDKSVELIVCHGNVIRYFLCRALQLPPEAWLRFSLPHCSVTSITIRGNGNVSVNQVGATSHLPARLQTLSNVN